MNRTLEYRREIDGLRAVAVVPVILFHAGFKMLQGGFVGVDVFFVISGYLITSLIVGGIEAGTFNLANFYGRRARRILPALFFVMLCCLPFAWAWLPPPDLRSFSQSVSAVVVFASNILFWDQSGYFDTANELKPLLHTWSLAVEEQFYVLFPATLIIGYRYVGNRLSLLILCIGAASLAASEILSRTSPDFNFYWLPTRAWELMAGALCIFYRSPPVYRRDNALSLAGLIVLALTFFEFSDKTRMPSLWGLIPVTATCAIILFSSHGTWAKRLLSLPPFVGIGLISYSAYLFHQPIFAFARVHLTEPPSTTVYGALIATTFIAATGSYWFIERPWRDKSFRRILSEKVMVRTAILTSLPLLAFGIAGASTNGFPSRIPLIAEYGARRYSAAMREGHCFLRPDQKFLDFDRTCYSDAALKLGLIWGDSHAAALSYGLRQEVGEIAQLTASGCPPIADFVSSERPNCKSINEYVWHLIISKKPKIILLHADWLKYDYAEVTAGLSSTIAKLRLLLPDTAIVVVGGVPQWQPTLPIVVWSKRLPLAPNTLSQPSQLEKLRLYDKSIAQVAASSGATFSSVLKAICRNDLCPVVVQSRGQIALTQFDYGHLTDVGSVYVAERLNLRGVFASAGRTSIGSRSP